MPLLARLRGGVATLAAACALTAVAATPAAAAPPPDRPAATCAATSQAPGTSADRTLTSGGRERSYRVSLPAGYADRSSWPVVLAYHGRGNTGAGTEEFSGLSRLPAIVVYPAGVVGTGDGDRQAWQGAPYAAAGVDDVVFTGDLIDELTRTLCADPDRVYAVGKSNGGGFTALLACRLGDRIAATAAVAGAYYPETSAGCAPARPVPAIAFHGTGDTTIPYDGDPERGLPAVPARVAEWARRDGCTAGPADTATPPDITTSTWTGCAGGGEVRLVTVAGGGHTWPGADSYSGGGATTSTIEATDVLWDFVSRYHLPRH